MPTPSPAFSLNVTGACAKFFPAHQDTLRAKTQNYHLNIWFQDLSVYESDLVPDFLKFLNYESSNLTTFFVQFQWQHFDYVLYVLYLLVFVEDWKLVLLDDALGEFGWEVPPIDFSVNSLSAPKKHLLLAKALAGYKPMLVNRWLVDYDYGELNPSAFVMIHMDRKR